MGRIKIIKTIKWMAVVNKDTYGSEIDINTEMSNSEIKEMVNILGIQIRETLQKVVNGKSDTDLRLEKTKERRIKCQ